MSESQRWFLLAGLALLAAITYLLAPILTPFLAGALLAYMSDPLADRLEAKGLNRTQSVIVVFVIISLVLLVAMLLLIPQLSDQIQTMVQQVPAVIQVFREKIQPWLTQHFGISINLPDKEALSKLVSEHWQQTGDFAAELMKKVSKSSMAIVTWLTNLFLVPVVTFYLLRDWDLMMAKIRRLLPRNLEGHVTSWAVESDEVLGAFVKGQLLVMCALGVIYSLGLWAVGLDLALLIGMLAGLASIVPYMGFIVGIVTALVAAYVQFQTPESLLWVLAVFGIGQALESMVLTPLLVGDRIGLHPVAVIFAIMAGGQLFGFVGVLLALPVAAVIMVLLRHLHDEYKQSRLYDTDQPIENGSENQIDTNEQ